MTRQLTQIEEESQDLDREIANLAACDKTTSVMKADLQKRREDSVRLEQEISASGQDSETRRQTLATREKAHMDSKANVQHLYAAAQVSNAVMASALSDNQDANEIMQQLLAEVFGTPSSNVLQAASVHRHDPNTSTPVMSDLGAAAALVNQISITEATSSAAQAPDMNQAPAPVQASGVSHASGQGRSAGVEGGTPTNEAAAITQDIGVCLGASQIRVVKNRALIRVPERGQG